MYVYKTKNIIFCVFDTRPEELDEEFHLQLLSKVTDLAVSCFCAENEAMNNINSRLGCNSLFPWLHKHNHLFGCLTGSCSMIDCCLLFRYHEFHQINQDWNVNNYNFEFLTVGRKICLPISWLQSNNTHSLPEISWGALDYVLL